MKLQGTKRRTYAPNSDFNSKFEAAVLDLTTSFLKSEKFKHGLTKGEEREIPIRDFLIENLPEKFGIEKGEAIDLFGNHSTQLDVMIYDKLKNVKFYAGDSTILPAEALLSSTEVKSLLTKDELRKSLIACNKLKSLKPFRRKLDETVMGRDINNKVKCRYFHTIFAYGTDIKKEDWAKNEFLRLKDVSTELKIDYKIIDRIYVVNYGIINPHGEIGVNEESDASLTLLYYYMHILSFLLRESKRRDIVPYLEYAGQMGKGWKKL